MEALGERAIQRRALCHLRHAAIAQSADRKAEEAAAIMADRACQQHTLARWAACARQLRGAAALCMRCRSHILRSALRSWQWHAKSCRQVGRLCDCSYITSTDV